MLILAIQIANSPTKIHKTPTQLRRSAPKYPTLLQLTHNQQQPLKVFGVKFSVRKIEDFSP